MNPIAVGRNIAKYRKAKELTQTMLADRLGVSNKAISKWECGRGLPDKSMIPNILNILGITLDQLCAVEQIRDDGGGVLEKYFRILSLFALAWILAACIMLVIFYGLAIGRITPVFYELRLNGALLADGTNFAVLTEGAAMPSVKTNGTKSLLGWADDANVFYGIDEFAMPAADTVLNAVYEEDLGDFFTPACSFEELVTGIKHTALHINIGPIQATKYTLPGGVAAGTGFKILNGYVGRPDACDNTCPVADDSANIVFLTFINEGAADLSLRYEVDFYRIIGHVNVTVPAGKQVRVPLCYDKAPPGFGGEPTAFHRLYCLNSVDDLSIVVYGQMYDPDYYEAAKETFELTLVGATLDGAASVALQFNATLPQNASLQPSATDKTLVGWKTGRGKIYVSNEELLRYFRMSAGQDTLTALYSEDMHLFTPSCVYKDVSRDDIEKRTGIHNADGSTTYTLESNVASWLIFNGEDEVHDVANGCPIDVTKERLYLMSVTNNGDKLLKLEIGSEYRGIRDPVTIDVPANTTVSVKVRVYGIETETSFWQINNLTATTGETSSVFKLTLVGRYS